MKKLHLFKTVLLLCALIVGSSSVWADSETITLSQQGYADKQVVSSTTSGDVTLTYTDGGTATTYYNTGNGVRVYAGGNMAITAGGNTITAVSITFAKNNSPSLSFTVNAGGSTTSSSASSSPGTWAGSATTVYFNVATKGHARIQAVTVTYTGATKHTLSSAVTPAGSGSVTLGATSVGEGKTTTILATPNSGYAFDHWSVTGDASVTDANAASTTFTMGTTDATVTANFTEVNYWVVTYDYNDGVTANENVNVLKAEAASYTLKAAPSRTNYTFNGWKIDETTYAAGAAYEPTANVTAQAQWTFSGTLYTYNRSNKSDLATGAQYVMGASDAGGTTWKFATGMGSNTYLGASVVGEYGSLDGDAAVFFDETPEIITLTETAAGWEMITENGKIGLKGNKQLGYDSGDRTWELGGTDEVPTFSATYDNSDYIMQFNSSQSRFNAYTSSQQPVYFYRLDDGKDVYTLTLDFNYGTVADEAHRVLEDASYTLVAPTRADYTFIGWNTEEDGTGTSYAAGAYTMPAAATTLYAQWRPNNVSVTITTAKYATFVSSYATDFSETDIAVYIATDNGETVRLNEVDGGQVPANTPVVLYKAGADGSAIDVPVIASADPVGSNDLEVSDGTTAKGDGIYVLSNKSKGVGFYPWVSASSLSAGKVFLRVAGGSAREFIGFDGETTGIQQVESSQMTVDSYYNLAGQRVAQPTKGLYIVNGKKVVIK